jgi:hypothetical protein
MAKHEYTEERSKEDAERILERVLRRQRWTAGVRDELASALRGVVGREVAAGKKW